MFSRNVCKLISFMYCGGHGDMPFRYPSKERLAPAPICSSKTMLFSLQPTFLADGGWGSESPAILVQCGGTTVISCGADQGSGRLHCISDSPANSPSFPSLSQGLSPRALLSKILHANFHLRVSFLENPTSLMRFFLLYPNSHGYIFVHKIKKSIFKCMHAVKLSTL